MKKMSIIGMALVAAMAVMAVTVASASAALPEFKTAAFPVTFTSENTLPLEPTLHSSVLGEKNVSCQMSKDSGEIASAKLVSKVAVTYTGCKEEGTSNPCTTTGQGTGTIVTKILKGRVGYLLPKSGVRSGIELEPAAGTVFAEFTCTGFAGKVTVEGCTIGEATPLNVSQKTGELTFVENAAKNAQLFVEIEGGLHKPCEQTVTASALKIKGKGWIMDKEVETFAANVELKA